MRITNRMDIRINSYIPVTEVEGIGKRFAIWTQGCPIRCEGCANKKMWDFDGGTLYGVEEFTDIIKSYSDKIEGITFLGGEPLYQIKSVKKISKSAQAMGLSVILFTGYLWEELEQNQEFKELIKYVDILIDGRYDKTKQDFSRPWVGSSNQRYFYLSERYSEKITEQYKNKIEVRISNDNKIVLTGMGDFSELTEIAG